MIRIKDIPINITIFPDNTSQVWNVENIRKGERVKVEWFYESENEIMQLVQLDILLNNYMCPHDLYIDYLPYARQDKEVSNSTTFALHGIAKVLNCMNWSSISIYDPHSETALWMIEKSTAIYPDLLKIPFSEILCFPDKGAVDKYLKHTSFRNFYFSVHKTRNPKTGNIEDLDIDGNLDLNNKTVRIIDDICDGGATFIKLATLLKSKYTNIKIKLDVSHGLFTKGTDVLKDAGIDEIYVRGIRYDF